MTPVPLHHQFPVSQRHRCSYFLFLFIYFYEDLITNVLILHRLNLLDITQKHWTVAMFALLAYKQHFVCIWQVRVFVVYTCSKFHIPTFGVGYLSPSNRNLKKNIFFVCFPFSFYKTVTVTKVHIFRKSATTCHSRTYEQVTIVSYPSHQFAHHVVITDFWTRKYGAGIFSKKLFIPSSLKFCHVVEI